jgi:hypothetical protein
VSGLVLVTGAARGGPGPAGRMSGLLLDRGVPVRASARTQHHRAEHLRQPGAEVAAGDLHEIADVEPGAGNNRTVGTATASSFLNSDAPLAGSGRRVVSVRGLGCRCRRAAARTPRGTARVFFREVLAGHGTMRRHASPLARHNRAICTQTTEPAIKPAQVNIRRDVACALKFTGERITLGGKCCH